jgi:O-antigen ligase
MILFIVAGISERSSGGAAEEGIDESAMGRLYAWEAAWNMALDNPILGVGISNFYYNYFAYSPHWDGMNHAVHSTWFGVLAESGFVGLILFVSLIVSTLLMSLKMLKTVNDEHHTPGIRVALNAAPAGIIGFIISGTFLTQGFIWAIYLQVALVIALNRYLTTKSNALKNTNPIQTTTQDEHKL